MRSFSKPFQHSLQATELNKSEKQVGIVLVAGGDPAKVREPIDAALDAIAARVTPQRTAILASRPFAAQAVRTDQFHSCVLSARSYASA